MFRKEDKPEEAAAFRSALQQPAQQREAAKQAALEACSAEHLQLLQCYRQGSLVACAAAREAFWGCYKRERGFGKTVVDALLTPKAGAATDAKK